MMTSLSNRDPYGVALGTMRRLANEGRFGPGDALVVTELAAEIGLSATPMREALARLAGEGLIERQQGRGYFYPMLSASEIVDLHELLRAYLHAALTLHYRGPTSLQRAAARSGDDVDHLSKAIVDQTGNHALIAAYGRVLARLGAAIRAENRLLQHSDKGPEIVTAAAEARLDDLVEMLARHHDRRCALAGRIAALLRAGDLAKPNIATDGRVQL